MQIKYFPGNTRLLINKYRLRKFRGSNSILNYSRVKTVIEKQSKDVIIFKNYFVRG